MADNVLIDEGTGTTIATDDVSSVHYQQVKLVDGTLDSTTVIAAGGGVEAGALRVTLASDSTGVVGIKPDNTISTDNSTTTPLGGDAVYSGTAEDVSSYTTVTITLDSDQNSATDGMDFQFSTNGSDWDDSYKFTYTAADGARRFQFPVTAQYFRVVFTNGATPQTHLRIQTILHRHTTLTSVHRLGDNVSPDRSAEVMKTALIAQIGGSGDFTPLNASTGGLLKVDLEEIAGNAPDLGAGATGAGTQRVVLANDTTLGVDGDVAHDSPDSGGGAPVKIGAKAESSLETATLVADADRTDLYADLDGVLITKPMAPFGDITYERVSDTAGTEAALTNFGAVASVRNFITTIVVTNTSATDTYVDFKDGSGGTIIFTVPAPANGGSVVNLPVPLRQPTANTALYYDVGAAATTVYISLVGFQSKA